MLAIIGGTGLYHLDGFKRSEEIVVETLVSVRSCYKGLLS